MLNEGTFISFKSNIQKQGYFPGSFVSSSTYHWNVEEHPQAWPGAPAGWDLSFHRGQKTQNEQVPQMGSENRASKKTWHPKITDPNAAWKALVRGITEGFLAEFPDAVRMPIPHPKLGIKPSGLWQSHCDVWLPEGISSEPALEKNNFWKPENGSTDHCQPPAYLVTI